MGIGKPPLEDMGVNREFWRNKRVLITGHTGFKGSWLCLWLHDLGANVTGYSLPPPTEPSLFEAAALASNMTSVIGDVRDSAQVLNTISKYEPDIIFHMAAQSLVRRSYQDPTETYGTNIMGTVNVLEAVRLSRTVKAVIVVTSDKCYENRESCSVFREDQPLGGHDPYSSSKACAELVTAAYRSSFFSAAPNEPVSPRLATVRAGNAIGGGDWGEDRLVPDIVRAFTAGKPTLIRSPDSTRPWQHVLDPLCGYLTLAERLCGQDGPDFCESWNFGPDDADSKPVSWIADQLARLWGNGAFWETDTRPQAHEAQHLSLDSSKARNRLAWSPKLSVSEAVAWTCQWYRAHHEGENVAECCRDQIASFEQRTAARSR
ncbi:MAG: CDP-glucose 4,6-dehydratase [Thermodesulfobacteriota bacterium]